MIINVLLSLALVVVFEIIAGEDFNSFNLLVVYFLNFIGLTLIDIYNRMSK